nr:putative ribonuclease H-like domain-containing protein [Ipomoea batatas]
MDSSSGVSGGMGGHKVVYLFLKELRPEVLANELDSFQMVTESRKLVTNLKSDGFNPAGGELRLVRIEAIALEWASNKGIDRLEIQCDNADVVRDVRNGTGREKTGCRILENCRRLIGEGEEMRLVHVFREQNAVADWLAQRAHVGDEEMIVFTKPPLGCVNLVQKDWIGEIVMLSVHESE